MNNWAITSLEGKISIKHGFPFKSEFFSDKETNFIVLTPGNFHEEGGFKRQAGKEKFYTGEAPEEYLHEAGDLIVAMTEQAAGLLGSCARVPESGIYLHNQRLGLITTDPNIILKDYVYHLFKTKTVREQVRLTSSGSKVKHTSPERIYNVKVPLPSVAEQQRIVNFLDALENKIDLNNRINTELEAMAKTLYDYWFVQFDFPDANGKPYKASGGKMVYDPTLKRDVPDEWEVTTVGKIATTELGGTPSTTMDEYWNDADIPWLSSAETASFPVTTSEQKITQAGIDNSAATLLPKGTVIISIVRYIRPSILGIDAATNQSVVGIRECKRLKSSFIYPYFCSEVPRLMGLRTGAQQPHINKGVIENSPIVIPSDKALTDYYKVADPIFEKIMNLAFQSQELMQIRDWLLPMLMNGQVTVKPRTESQEIQHG